MTKSSFKFPAFLGNDVLINDAYLYFFILLFKFVISRRDVTCCMGISVSSKK